MSHASKGTKHRAWAAIVAAALCVLRGGNVFGGHDMPMLNWMGREKAVKQDKEVLLKILREDKSLGKCCQCANVASTNSNDQLGNGNIGIGNTSTMATFDNVLVHGDNLEALKALLPSYAGEGGLAA